MTTQPGAPLYTAGFGIRNEDVEVPTLQVRNPAPTDVNFPQGKLWVNTAAATAFILASFNPLANNVTANWTQLGGGGSFLAQLLSDAGVSMPSGGSISILGATNQITTSAAAHILTISLVNNLVTPGSLTTTTFVSAGNGVTATTGNVDALAGDVFAQNNVIANTGNITANTGDIVATAGNITAAAGTISANVDVTAIGQVVAVTGDVVASAGRVIATLGNIIASAGDINAVLGNINAGAAITAGTGITASSGNIAASTGNVTAAGDVSSSNNITAGKNITSTLGNITASGGDINASAAMSAGTSITAVAGNIVATAGEVNAGASMTAATTITATAGDITATNGNFVSSFADKGLVFNVIPTSTAFPLIANANARVGSATFTSISIAPGAAITLQIGNIQVAGASTRILYSLRGATTGAALCVGNVINSAGLSQIDVTNGSTVTTQIDDLTLEYILLN